MTLFSRILIAVLKPVMLGIVVAAILLAFFPEFRQGAGLDLNIFKNSQTIPPRMSYYDALERSAPAVVNIYSISLENDNRIFRSRRTYERTSLGSGVIMSDDGYLLTCYHVIQNADSIYVTLQDSRLLQAQLVGFDEITDLAVLRVFAEDLHVIPQMENPDLRVGDVVMAIGNPLDLGQTITSGIVSRAGLSTFSTFFDFIQTDAVLNQGNSGGALVDSNGYLVGITNANFKTIDERRRVTSVDGVNFAVPYELARRVMDEIILNGKVTRGQLGFTGGELRDNPGIVVDSVSTNSPAAAAGLQVNDILLEINGTEVNSAAKTRDLIAETKPGSEMTLVVSRDGEIIEMTVVVGELLPQMIARG
uniref:trypsin-like peptidase domain-containing protein n=1 Tax=Ningiella ruwaisensis TaxID=2364274 RepID=UPI00109F85A0|nr:trypsin-like peptidase domain-containing protein [Ningiella ruwaisensis]